MMQEFLTEAKIAGILLALPLSIFIIGLVIISIGPGLKAVYGGPEETAEHVVAGH